MTYRRFGFFIAIATLAAASWLTTQAAVQDGDSIRQAEAALQAAINKETVDGDVNGAIADYKQIVATYPGARAVVARSLVRMGLLFQKLSKSTEANAAFERIVREFGDQKEALGVAQGQIAASVAGRSKSPAGLTDRLILTSSPEPHRELDYGNVSLDGRYLAYEGEAFHLFLHDFRTGTARQLTSSPVTSGLADEFSLFRRAFSVDGKQLAYSWYTTSRPGGQGGGLAIQLRVSDLQGTGLLKPRVLIDNAEIDWIEPHGWAPNGQWIAVTLQRPDRTGQIGLVSTRDGSLAVLKSFPWRGQFQMSLSPDGKYLAFDLPGTDTRARDIFILTTEAARETAAVVYDGDDALVGWSPDGTQLLFASDRTGSRSLWAQAVQEGRPQGRPTPLKPSIPQFSVMGLTSSGSLYYRVEPRQLSNLMVASFDFRTGQVLSMPTEVQEFSGANSNPAWSHDGKLLAYISDRRPSPARERVLAIRSVDTGKIRELRSPELNASVLGPLRWSPDDRTLTIGTREFGGPRGFYRIDAQTGGTTAIMKTGNDAGVLGESSYTLAPDGKKVYFLRRAGQVGQPYNELLGLAFVVERDLASGVDRELFQIVAGGSGYHVSPDGRTFYYRRLAPGDEPGLFLGKNVPIVRDLVARDLATGRERDLIASAGGNVRVSADSRFAIATINDSAANARTLVVVDTRDGARRELMRVTQPEPLGLMMWAPDGGSVFARKGQEIWWVPMDGREPRKVDLNVDLQRTPLLGLTPQPGGHRVAFTQQETGRLQTELWLLENFLPSPIAKP